jgi:hypothetical protein
MTKPIDPHEPTAIPAQLTLRDYFAAEAMAAFIVAGRFSIEKDSAVDRQISQAAFAMANAMLRAREGGSK